ncbi:hypothetical protein [Devosia sp. RR2S18]|uniref:hypothetical protein n=1 Tax=Devosia rhizosphaerae TaxID=3049774 RepID=UPI00253FC0E1|nr:hypothetical protein [Devosia sp. RR2S18]WIJ23997.1 hypothetical protein QOV41_13265 [Devosia sp. RR2S18]
MSNSNRGAILPPTFFADYDVFIAANRKGGIGKTTIILFLIACALLRKAVLRAFEIDRQSRLQRMYPGIVEQVDLPSTDQLIEDDLSEGRALARVWHALRSAKETGLVFLDIGANYEERVAEGMLRARIHKSMAAAGRRVCVLIPLDGASDTITAAATAVRHFGTAVPEAEFVFVQRQAELTIDSGAQSLLSDAARKAYVEVIAPLRVPERTLNMGQMRQGIHRAFVALAKNPLDFMESSPALLGAAAAGAAGDPLQDEFAGMEILAYFDDFVGQIDEEAQRVLGFRTATGAPGKNSGPSSKPA